MLISRPIPALYGGVSQQPATQMSAIQLKEMVNSWPTIVDGLGKRPPTEHLALLSASPYDTGYIHTINRDTTERYVVVIAAGDLKVFDMAGVQKTVTFPSGKAYLTPAGGLAADAAFACVTVADYTFVLNKTVAVELDVVGADTAAQPTNYWNLNRPPGAGGAYQYQYPPNIGGGSYMGTVQTFQDLPDGAAEGAIYQVKATVESGFSGYYVRKTSGTWVEVPAPGLRNALKATTLPWALVRLGNGTFEFSPFSWAPRRAGDLATNPGPSFIGRKLNDIFFIKNRLAMTVDENAIMSRAGDFGNFWRMSAIDLFDDDVIDVAATETKVTKLLHAVPLQGDVMLFSDQVQFRLDTGAVLTPTSCSLAVTTQYPTAPLVKPQPLGADIYFATEENGWVRLLEYFVKDESNAHDAADLTSHVPRYIPQGLRQIIPSADHDAIFLLTRGAGERIYHYKFYWANETEKAQAAWGHWEFEAGTKVLAGAALGAYLYLVVQRTEGTYLERLSLANSASASGLSFEVYLDRRKALTGTYVPVSDYTEFTLPYPVTADHRPLFRIVRGGGFASGKGGLLDTTSYTWVSNTVVRVPSNVSASGCFVGYAYEQRWTFPEWFMRNSQNEPDLSGRLQVRTVTLYYTRAGYFATEVAPYGTDAEVEAIIPSKLAEFTGKTLGNAELIVGDPSFDDGAYSFQVYGNSKDCVISITNDSHLGAWFTSAEVEFFWQKRARFG